MEILEIAAENDVQKFKNLIYQNPKCVDEIGFWYLRSKISNHMIYDQRTPLMVAATYGSVDVVSYILTFPNIDVNRRVGCEMTTALHCAASGGSPNAVDVVSQLISAGADSNFVDMNGLKASDVLFISPKVGSDKRIILEETLANGTNLLKKQAGLRVLTSSSSSSSPPLSDADFDHSTPSSDSLSSPNEKKEYTMDPPIPDIKNGIYSTDEFRMFSFKIRPCSRAYSHDWTECPFAHPGENARRRDPRKYHYSCVPCPDFRRGACHRGDLCEYAHGVFECWLHPAQYRTRLCKDGIGCSRRVCFFAHNEDELRPLFVSTGSAVPSPRSMDMLHFPFTPPMSPSTSWNQHNVPTLHLPSSNVLSRLRASLSARDMRPSNLNDVFSAEVECYKSSNVDTMNRLLHDTKDRYLRSLSSRELGSNMANVDSKLNLPWSDWSSPNGKLDWGVSGEELDMINRSKFKVDEHDVSHDVLLYEDIGVVDQVDEHSVLGDWLEDMQLSSVATS